MPTTSQHRIWLRGCAFSLTPADHERHGLAFYRTETDCVEREEQPLYVIPFGAEHADDVIATSLLLTIRCDPHYTSLVGTVF